MVLLLMNHFNLIFKAAQKPGFWELLEALFGTVVMLAFGYARKPDPREAWISFSFGRARHVHVRVLVQRP